MIKIKRSSQSYIVLIAMIVLFFRMALSADGFLFIVSILWIVGLVIVLIKRIWLGKYIELKGNDVLIYMDRRTEKFKCDELEKIILKRTPLALSQLRLKNGKRIRFEGFGIAEQELQKLNESCKIV